ncbi:uncharacterized protein LOC110022570 isoform X2 [Phalaenopsis equestris]|uniref:uncharacterized protein LOC110022570 isoform X2 n=1 Tax=Phalaenopsis equestris TaxID=78828 RepID=UPI0009E432D7|nr:uncharacterized protein LOC110022570 isoform X2 [Phalaenopsis equestris]
MSEKMEDAEFWLPSEFLDEDFFLEERRALVGSDNKGSYVGDSIESESEEEDYIAGLTRQMAHSFLDDEKLSTALNAKIMATSPQSTLCDTGIWTASNEGSPNGPSQVSSPPSTPFEQRKDDAWDILYAAAGQVGRMRQNEQRISGRGLLIPPKKPSPRVESQANLYRSYNPIFTQQQLQAAQFFQLKQQQLIKQQVTAAWSRQNRATRNNRQPNLVTSAWPPLQRQQPGSGMRAVFLNSSGTRRESTGTGVFLPRRAGNHNESRKKPSCSTVLLPAKVVQALSLNLEDSAVNHRYPGCFPCDHEMASTRGNGSILLQKPHYHHQPPALSGHEIQLPQEWTY